MNIYIFRIPKRPHGPSDSSFHLLHGPPRRREDQGYSSLLYPPSPLLVSLSCLTFLLFLYVYLIVIKFGTIHNRSYDHGQRHLLSCLPHPLFRFLLLPRHLWYVFIDLLMRYSSFCSHLFFQFYFNVYFYSLDRKAFFWNMQLLFIVSLGIAVFFGSVYLLSSFSFLLFSSILFSSLLFYFLFFSFTAHIYNIAPLLNTACTYAVFYAMEKIVEFGMLLPFLLLSFSLLYISLLSSLCLLPSPILLSSPPLFFIF